MMIKKNQKIETMLNNLSDKEKIRMFYELAKEIVYLDDGEFEELDDDMQNLIEDIANVVNDIENL